ncbi:hypothetical protein PRIPAC_80802 [Pristionchus pacificus]|uniref:Uncharacterized protein n=1 Tax=Pristionchus pacificus TaxID=54126 RepID=A0A2A6BYQ3_PRIPA|nr:hypothetical protein PRIPAC_80802 [Pristionchus pacificus]|eukprot:PDM70999.1 hypothetical protein PRIPAC_44395 [Pristionchus pacificus]
MRPFAKKTDKTQRGLAQLKNFKSLKLGDLGFSRVLMTIGIGIFHIASSLAPDDVEKDDLAGLLSGYLPREIVLFDVVRSQRRRDMKNASAYRHQHP